MKKYDAMLNILKSNYSYSIIEKDQKALECFKYLYDKQFTPHEYKICYENILRMKSQELSKNRD